MQIIPKKDLEKFSLPLPIYKTIHIADATGKDGDEFSILVGLNKDFISQLKNYSLDLKDIEIQNNTSDRKRFGLGSYEDWYKKNRTPFALIHKNTNKLAALIWFGPEALVEKEGNWHTAAWRSYPLFRGKGLMKEFGKFVMKIYTENMPNVKFWITVKKENAGSIGFAQMLGFEELPEESDSNSCIMVKY